MKNLDHEVHLVMMRLAHDVRNPITVILSNLRYLMEEISDTDQLEAVAESLLAAEQASHLIDDVVDLQHLHSTQQSPAFNLRQLSPQLLRTLEPQRGNRTLDINLPDVRIKGKETFVARALTNILEHCLKQTPSRGIVTLGGELSRGLTLHILDQGLPFNPNVLPSILCETLTAPAASDGAWRSDQGLAIHFAGQALRSLGATVETKNRADGSPGVIFSITFPPESIA